MSKQIKTSLEARNSIKKGMDIFYKAMRKSDKDGLVSAANFWFGGWGKAIGICGLPYAEIRKK